MITKCLLESRSLQSNFVNYLISDFGVVFMRKQEHVTLDKILKLDANEMRKLMKHKSLLDDDLQKSIAAIYPIKVYCHLILNRTLNLHAGRWDFFSKIVSIRSRWGFNRDWAKNRNEILENFKICLFNVNVYIGRSRVLTLFVGIKQLVEKYTWIRAQTKSSMVCVNE
jgi:hypothetical protein